MRGKTRETGGLCEGMACKYLESLGFKILAKNFRVGRIGEIDIIAKDNEHTCFIEVKARSSEKFGKPSESIVAKKRKTIQKVASMYLSSRGLYDKIPVRFDALEVYFGLDEAGTVYAEEFNLIKNAF